MNNLNIGQNRAIPENVPPPTEAKQKPKSLLGKIFHAIGLGAQYSNLATAAYQQQGATRVNAASTPVIADQYVSSSKGKERKAKIISDSSGYAAKAHKVFAQAQETSLHSSRRSSSDSAPVEDSVSTQLKQKIEAKEGQIKQIRFSFLKRGEVKALKSELQQLKTAHKVAAQFLAATQEEKAAGLETLEKLGLLQKTQIDSAGVTVYKQVISELGSQMSDTQKASLAKTCLAADRALRQGHIVEAEIGGRSYYLSSHEGPKEVTFLGKGADAQVFHAEGKVYKRPIDSEQARIAFQNEKMACEKLKGFSGDGMEFVAQLHDVTTISGSKGSQEAMMMEYVGGGDMEARTLVLNFAHDVLGLSEDQIAEAQQNPHIFDGKEEAIAQFSAKTQDEDHPAIPPDTLRTMFAKFKPLDQQGRQTLAYQVLSGMGALISQGVFHNDLSVNNILIGENGIKIADFGKAQSRDAEYEKADRASGFIIRLANRAQALEKAFIAMQGCIGEQDTSGKGKETLLIKEQFLQKLCDAGIMTKTEDGQYLVSDNHDFYKNLGPLIDLLAKGSEPKSAEGIALLAKLREVGLVDGLKLHPGIQREYVQELTQTFTFLKKPITGVVTEEYISRFDQGLVELYARVGEPARYAEMLEKQQVMMTGIAIYKLVTGDFPSESLRLTSQGREEMRQKLASAIGGNQAQVVMDMIAEISLSDDDARMYATKLGCPPDRDAHEFLSVTKLKDPPQNERPNFSELQERIHVTNFS